MSLGWIRILNYNIFPMINCGDGYKTEMDIL